jgi:CRISPR system Cascade subunit CasC
MNNLYIDVHVLQTLPPNNINRDETGSPKSAIFGGAVRQRISSQAFKRAVRTDMAKSISGNRLGLRTKDLPVQVQQAVLELTDASPETAMQWALEALKAAGLKPERPKTKKGDEPKPEETKYLVFVGQYQVKKLARLAVENQGTFTEKSAKTAAKAALKQDQAIDVSLFGRMVADAADLNVDAAVQVAHSISVHENTPEFDYFTAVDDLRGEDEQGADMIGTVEFTASTVYRYATLNVPALMENLGDADATSLASAEFVRSFIRAMPTGKQNTFANRTLPSVVVVSFSTSQPSNWVGAFEKPVLAGQNGYVYEAATAMAKYATDLDAAYGESATRLVLALPVAGDSIARLGETVDLDALVERVREVAADVAAGR